MATYADADDLVERFDARTIGDLVSDDGTRVEATDLSSDARVTAALTDASGDVESALVVADRYSTADLEGLTGNALSTLKRIVCDLAMSYLYGRRPAYKPEQTEAFEKRAREHLDRLRNGENVFNLQDQREAGLPTIGGPTMVEYDNLNLWRDRTRNYYPARRLPDNR